ncbi:DUF3040 domain-containing protein [Streptomyces sp. NBC_01476]|uniref:DUF3040 domain-containing protein n=1 Tax=Streptomyces sp. NBC_01476 TaxID=2903881 RepID=UPI002E321807|nr:DUF3040 domain-containing protein [Streptomyces sp. NBC_01476]
MDDISLSAREMRVLQELEKVLRREDRRLDRRMRSAGHRAGGAKTGPGWNGPARGRPVPNAPGPSRRTPGGQRPGGPGRGAWFLTVLSASLLVAALGASGRLTRRMTALAFGAVWLTTRLTTHRHANA